MRIVQYLSRMRMEDGGVVRAVVDLCGALAARGHEVLLMTFDATDVPTCWGSGGGPHAVVLTRARGRVLRPDAASRHRARGVIEDADALHLHVPWDPVCARFGRVARDAGVPYVVGVHGMLDDWSMAQSTLKKRLYLAAMGRRLLELAARVHLTAEAERHQSQRWYPRGRPVVLPLVVDLEPYRDLPGPELARRAHDAALDGRRPTMLYLSRLHPKKRVDLMIEAAALLRDAGAPVGVVIAGRGDEEYERGLRALVAERGLDGDVHFAGFVSGREKISLYEACDLFVLPTSQENWGFVLIEALACGTPVITTRGVDIWSELESTGGAVIVEQTAAAVADAARAMLADADRLRAMGARAREWVLENLAVDTVTRRYEEMYASLR